MKPLHPRSGMAVFFTAIAITWGGGLLADEALVSTPKKGEDRVALLFSPCANGLSKFIAAMIKAQTLPDLDVEGLQAAEWQAKDGTIPGCWVANGDSYILTFADRTAYRFKKEDFKPGDSARLGSKI